jgi:hypothetical protein
VSRSFNGTSAYINVGSHAVLQPAAITISFWVNPTSTSQTAYATLVSLENNVNSGGVYFISLSASGGPKLAYYFNNSGTSIDPGSNSLTAGVWSNVIATYIDSPGLNAYVNGVSDGFTGSTTPLATSGNPTTIGALYSSGSPSLFFNGMIADVGMWNVILAAGEIAALAAGARPYTIRPGSLVGYWPLDGLASPEPDLSGNANNGTLTGTALGASGPPLMMFTPRWPQFLPSAAAPTFALIGAQSMVLM